MAAKGTALPGSCWQGGGGDGGCGPLLFPSLPSQRRDGDGGRRSNPTGAPGHPRNTSGSWDTRVPSCLAPPSRGQHRVPLRDRSDIHAQPSSPSAACPAHSCRSPRSCTRNPKGVDAHRDLGDVLSPAHLYLQAPGTQQSPSNTRDQHLPQGKQLHPLPPSQKPFYGPTRLVQTTRHPTWTTEGGQSNVPRAPPSFLGHHHPKKRMAAWKRGCQPSRGDATPPGAVAQPPGTATEQLPPRAPPSTGRWS